MPKALSTPVSSPRKSQLGFHVVKGRSAGPSTKEKVHKTLFIPSPSKPKPHTLFISRSQYRNHLTPKDEAARQMFMASLSLKQSGSVLLRASVRDRLLKDGTFQNPHPPQLSRYNDKKMQRDAHGIYYLGDGYTTDSLWWLEEGKNVLGGESLKTAQNGYFYADPRLFTGLDKKFKTGGHITYLIRETQGQSEILGGYRLHISEHRMSPSAWEDLNHLMTTPKEPPVLVVAEFIKFDPKLTEVLYCANEIIRVDEEHAIAQLKPEKSSPKKRTQKEWNSFQTSMHPSTSGHRSSAR